MPSTACAAFADAPSLSVDIALIEIDGVENNGAKMLTEFAPTRKVPVSSPYLLLGLCRSEFEE